MMKRAWKHLTSLIALVVLLSATADGQQKVPPTNRPLAVADPLRAILEKKGYVAVPLNQEDEEERFTVECKSGTETFRLNLDTGAENSSLDLGLVKKLGLKHGDVVKTAGIDGIRTGVEVSLRGHSIGDFDTRAMANSLSLQAFDLTALNTARDQRKVRRIDGLLGSAALRLDAAVIDYSTRTLYLRTPLEGLWPEIEGQWVATSGQEDGQKRPIDPKAPPRLGFKDRRFHLTDGTNRYIFGLHVRPEEKDRYTLVFFDPEQEFAKELCYKAGGLLKVSGDKLTVCLVLDPAKAKGFPDDFTAPADSGYLLLEFRREKPRPAAATVPPGSMLKKQGYVAIPLTQEEGSGHFIVECKSGPEMWRLLLDTGAEVSCLDTGLVKKLDLKPKREITGVGTGGIREGVEVSLRGLSIGGFDTRTTTNSFAAAAFDFTAMNTALAQHRNLRPIDGVLGHLDLNFYSAVIDYSTRTLYLRKPLDELWPKIEGRWVATSGQEDGQERKLDPTAPPRLEFKDRLFGLTDGGKIYRFGMHVKPGKDRYTLAFFDPWKEKDGELNYKAVGLLKVSGDKLTVCLCLDILKAKEFPDDFKAPAGSGRLLLEFRREK